AGDIAFQGLDFPGFSLTVFIQGQGDAAVLVGDDVARRRPFSPIDHGLKGAVLEADGGVAGRGGYGCSSGLAGVGGGGEGLQEMPRNRTLPELVKAGRVAG